MSPAKTSLEKKKCCKLMIKPRRYGGKSPPGTPTQEQTRPITTETSNLVEKSTLWYFLQRRALKNKSCKLMTKPRRYGGKSHPATPTQEQTSPISTETSNLYKKYAVFDVSCKNEHWKKKPLQTDDQTTEIWWKISSWDATQEQTRPITTETSNLVEKVHCLWFSCKDEPWKKKNVASWWPNRAGMVENLIPQRQLRSKRDKYRRKLAI